MFVAYSEKLHDKVNVRDAYDLDEVFCCLNPHCTAKFTIRSATGKKSKYFGRLKSTPHIPGCEYEMGDSRYVQPDLQIRSSIEAIYGDFLNPDTHQKGGRSHHEGKKNTVNKLRISTPKTLLNFCLMNSLKTEYAPSIKVDDIILDKRNLIDKGRFEGIEGYRILVGETVERYKNDELALLLTAVSRYGKQVYLHATAKVDPEQLRYIRKHIINTYSSYEGHPIAIFGKWKIDRKYYISCSVPDKKHIILKF